jgi:hypothetical protein
VAASTSTPRSRCTAQFADFRALRMPARGVRHRRRQDAAGRFLPADVVVTVFVGESCSADLPLLPAPRNLGVPLLGFVDDSPRDSFLGLPVAREPGDVKANGARRTGRSTGSSSRRWLNQDAIREAASKQIGFPLERVTLAVTSAAVLRTPNIGRASDAGSPPAPTRRRFGTNVPRGSSSSVSRSTVLSLVGRLFQHLYGSRAPWRSIAMSEKAGSELDHDAGAGAPRRTTGRVHEDGPGCSAS